MSGKWSRYSISGGSQQTDWLELWIFVIKTNDQVFSCWKCCKKEGVEGSHLLIKK